MHVLAGQDRSGKQYLWNTSGSLRCAKAELSESINLNMLAGLIPSQKAALTCFNPYILPLTFHTALY